VCALQVGGVQFASLFTENSAGISVGFCLFAQLLSVCINIFLTWYIGQIDSLDSSQKDENNLKYSSALLCSDALHLRRCRYLDKVMPRDDEVEIPPADRVSIK
jgi:hypothetical protein